MLSYTKMLGQLRDGGNTTTLAHYLELLAGAGLPKFSGRAVRQRGQVGIAHYEARIRAAWQPEGRREGLLRFTRTGSGPGVSGRRWPA